MGDSKSTGNWEIIQCLEGAEALYVLTFGCTKEPYIICDPGLFDDGIYMFFTPEDARVKAGEPVDGDTDIRMVELEDRQTFTFYTSSYTMGVSVLAAMEGAEERHIQLVDSVRRGGSTQDSEDRTWVENPGLHLTALYHMQEPRRQPAWGNSPQLREWQEEISNYFAKGSSVVPVQKRGNGIPVIKLNDQEVYQAILTDIMEFQKSNRENQLRPLAITADKTPQILVAKAMGVLLNPMGVRVPLQIKKQAE